MSMGVQGPRGLIEEVDVRDAPDAQNVESEKPFFVESDKVRVILKSPGIPNGSLKIKNSPAIVCICSYCKLYGAKSLCSQCKMTYYCSKECQRKDWKVHKKSCRYSQM